MKALRGLWPYALILAAALAVQAYRGRDMAQGSAPPLSGITVAGRPFDLAQLRGKPALVYFWATWCGVCKAMQQSRREAEKPRLPDNIDALGGDVPMIAVALQSGDAAEVGRFLKERGIAMPVLLDEDGDAAARYGIRGVPAAFVLDADGGIRYVAMGYSTELGLRLRLWLTTALLHKSRLRRVRKSVRLMA